MKYMPNKIKVDLGSYRHYWRGQIKSGKTTLFRDLVREAYGDYKYGLIISPGNETGYKALDGVYAVEAPTWEDFVSIVDDLVENKHENEFKMVALDTVDEIVSIAEDRVMKVHFQREGSKAKSLNSALGGYGAGQKMATEIINDQIKRIESAGYGLVFISHTKVRDIKEKGTEESYQQLTTNLDSRYNSIFSDKADIIATIYVDREVKEGSLLGTTRYIYFRTDGFVDAGSRFSNIPERVELSAKNYLKAFEDAVKQSFETPVTDKEIEKMKKEEVKEVQEKAKEYSISQKNFVPETVEELRIGISEALQAIDVEMKNQMKERLKEEGLPSRYNKEEDVEVLKKIYKVVTSG